MLAPVSCRKCQLFHSWLAQNLTSILSLHLMNTTSDIRVTLISTLWTNGGLNEGDGEPKRY